MEQKRTLNKWDPFKYIFFVSIVFNSSCDFINDSFKDEIEICTPPNELKNFPFTNSVFRSTNSNASSIDKGKKIRIKLEAGSDLNLIEQKLENINGKVDIEIPIGDKEKHLFEATYDASNADPTSRSILLYWTNFISNYSSYHDFNNGCKPSAEWKDLLKSWEDKYLRPELAGNFEGKKPPIKDEEIKEPVLIKTVKRQETIKPHPSSQVSEENSYGDKNVVVGTNVGTINYTNELERRELKLKTDFKLKIIVQSNNQNLPIKNAEIVIDDFDKKYTNEEGVFLLKESYNLYREQDTTVHINIGYNEEYKSIDTIIVLNSENNKAELNFVLEKLILDSIKFNKTKIKVKNSVNLYWTINDINSVIKKQDVPSAISYSAYGSHDNAKAICNSLKPGNWRLPYLDEIESDKKFLYKWLNLGGYIVNGSTKNKNSFGYYWIGDEEYNCARIAKDKNQIILKKKYFNSSYNAYCKCVREI